MHGAREDAMSPRAVRCQERRVRTCEVAAEGGANNGVHHQIAREELESLGFGVLLEGLLDVARLQIKNGYNQKL